MAGLSPRRLPPPLTLWMWAVLLVSLLTPGATLTEKRLLDQRPNFIIMLMDDMGYGDLGSMGEPNRETSNIDSMAQEGMLFPEFYTGAAICSPSRAAMLTGRLPIRNGFYSTNNFGHNAYTPQEIVGGISDSEVLLPELLSKAGYTNALIGKWHLGHRPQYQPLDHGFHSWFGSPNCHFGPYDDKSTPNIPVYRDRNMMGRYYEDFHINITSGESNYTRLLADEAVAFLEAQVNSIRPFFLLWTPDASHAPHYASRPFLGRSRRGLYGDAVMELDHSVGRILDTLKRTNLTNTLVFFSSDNGAALVDAGYGGDNGRLLCGKQTTFEGGFRVPTIAWWPGVVPPGQVSQQVGTQMDLFTTFAELAGQAIPGDRIVDGINLVSALTNENTTERSVFFYRGDLLMATRVGRYKAHTWTFTTPVEELKKGIDHCPGACVANLTTSVQINRTLTPVVIDLARDPGETYPLKMGTAEYTRVVSEVWKVMDEHLHDMVEGRPALDWCDDAVMNWSPPGCEALHECLRAPASDPYKCDWPH
ncbi:N-acetylgalactosamine-6-sulfatase-like isoform X2 [Pollicipes pollicipes]|nr:N-acetylgalactosamine-6-sulfatase-like isoform X2 [Pollicipes pollicipes]